MTHAAGDNSSLQPGAEGVATEDSSFSARDAASSLAPEKNPQRWAIVLVLIAAVAVGHWITPIGPLWLHAVHVLLRKLFIVPILMSAIWFGLRGAALTTAIVSAFYLPHILLAWSGRIGENINQLGEIATYWIVGCIAGWLVHRERAALKRTARMSEGALKALVAALDAREHQTEQHSQRVAALAHRLGVKLGLDRRRLEVLRQAALLHDIGKIGVPDEVLLKPGPLTAGERQVMQQHAELGHDILRNVPHLNEVAQLVQAHHERFDGTGYPLGLRGEEIPLGARIFAVADVFDALTSVRPYRQPMDPKKARSVIREASGSHFDPAVVEAFESVSSEARGART